MTITSDPNTWVIYGLVFVLGVLVGLFLTAGGRKKWKTRYYDEVDRRKVIERDHATAEADWKERERTHEAALRDAERNRAAAAAAAAAPVAVAATDRRVVEKGTVIEPGARKANFVDRMLGRDQDRDGVDDRTEATIRPVRTGIDRDGDGVDDRDE